jgi:hypothetical protein
LTVNGRDTVDDERGGGLGLEGDLADDGSADQTS